MMQSEEESVAPAPTPVPEPAQAPAPVPVPVAAAGYLQKRSRYLHRWERVYCRLLDGGSLAYAAEPPNGGGDADDWVRRKAKCLSLTACTLKPLAASSGRERAFEITTVEGQTVALSAETDADLDMWMSAFLLVRGGRGGAGPAGNSNTGCCLQ